MVSKMNLRVVLVFWVSIFGSVLLSPIDLTTDLNSMLFLAKYGYMEPFRMDEFPHLNETKMSRAIEQFQNFYNLTVTGTMNNETREMMQMPRCGMKDIMGTAGNRAKRYALQGSRWRTKNLSYRIMRYPREVPREGVDRTVQEAFNVWSKVVDLTFAPRSGRVNIAISFAGGEHGDGDPFDGPSGVLAHAYFPQFGGTTHFDDAEKWTLKERRGINLFQVAVHEFGHALGLSHSDVRAAVMFPTYMGYVPNFALGQDDIDGITMIYGQKTPDTPMGGDGGNGAGNGVDLCGNFKIDTVLSSAEGRNLYILSGDNYWLIDRNRLLRNGYPKTISSNWPGLPGSIDAAFTYGRGRTYFFKGNQFWRYRGQTLDPDYPKAISAGFPGIPDNVDAAMQWTGNGKIYFFKGDQFWKLDPTKRPPVENTYPKKISTWQGIPNNLDAAFTYRGYTFFIKNDVYYRFNDRAFAVDNGRPAYPRSTAYWWLACSNAPSGTVGGGNIKTAAFYEDYDDTGIEINSNAGVHKSSAAAVNNQTSQTNPAMKSSAKSNQTSQTNATMKSSGNSATFSSLLVVITFILKYVNYIYGGR